MTTARLSRAIAAAALTGLVAATSACGSGDGTSGAASASGSSSGSASGSAGGSPPASAVRSAPFGPGCAGLPADGPGSLAALATVPAATAVGANPLTGALAQAVIAANLVDVLNSRPDITVLAPVDSAFQSVEPGALGALMGDVPRLTTVVTHHVLNGRLTPEQLVGEHPTLNGDTVTIAGSGTDLTIPADQTLPGAVAATVVCGNVQTTNATLYLVDQVLTPAAAG